MKDSVVVEIQRGIPGSTKSDVLRVIVEESKVLVQGALSIIQDIPLEDSRTLLLKGKSMWSSDSCYVLDPDGRILVTLYSCLNEAEARVVILQRDFERTPQIEDAFEFLVAVERVLDIDHSELTIAAESICLGRAP